MTVEIHHPFGAKEATRLRQGSGVAGDLRGKEGINHSWLFGSKRSNNAFEARIAAERVPDREQFQGAVAQHD